MNIVMENMPVFVTERHALYQFHVSVVRNFRKIASRHFPSFVIATSTSDISPRSTTRRLAIMALALRGIEADFGPENADTFRRDLESADDEVRMWD